MNIPVNETTHSGVEVPPNPDRNQLLIASRRAVRNGTEFFLEPSTYPLKLYIKSENDYFFLEFEDTTLIFFISTSTKLSQE